MRRIAALCLILFVFVPVARASGLRVVVSISPQKWFAERIAGDLAEVRVMVRPGASPHEFEPRPSQMRSLAEADLYLALGLGFEGVWLPRFLAANPGLRVARTDAGIVKTRMEHAEREADRHGAEAEGAFDDHGHHAGEGESHGHEDAPRASETGHAHAGADPHIWLSPELAKTIARNTRDALAGADPAHAATYDAGLDSLLADIEQLQVDLARRFTGLARRRFMIFHPSWGYFAREFGLVQMPVEIDGREPSPGELAALVTHAGEYGLRTVFVQPQLSRRAADLVAREIDGRVAEADPLAEDWLANMRIVARRFERAMRE